MSKVTGAESLVGTKLGQRPFSHRLAQDGTPARSTPVGHKPRRAQGEQHGHHHPPHHHPDSADSLGWRLVRSRALVLVSA